MQEVNLKKLVLGFYHTENQFHQQQLKPWKFDTPFTLRVYTLFRVQMLSKKMCLNLFASVAVLRESSPLSRRWVQRFSHRCHERPEGCRHCPRPVLHSVPNLQPVPGQDERGNAYSRFRRRPWHARGCKTKGSWQPSGKNWHQGLRCRRTQCEL